MDVEQIYAIHTLGINYGADAYFVFEKDMDTFNDSQEVKEKLSAAIKKMPFADFDVNGKLDIDLETQRNTDDVRVTFHGDFTLSEYPTNFREAVSVYKNMSLMMTGPNP